MMTRCVKVDMRVIQASHVRRLVYLRTGVHVVRVNIFVLILAVVRLNGLHAGLVCHSSVPILQLVVREAIAVRVGVELGEGVLDEADVVTLLRLLLLISLMKSRIRFVL